MRKKSIKIAFITIFCIIFGSVVLYQLYQFIFYRYAGLDEKEHVLIEELDDDKHVIFNEIYYRSPIQFRNVIAEQEYLGWIGLRWFYNHKIYGDSLVSPTYIHVGNGKWSYLRQDYDVFTDSFIIEGTDDAICFGTDLEEYDQDIQLFNRRTYTIYLYSEKYPTLKVMLTLIKHKGVWYAVNGMQEYTMSEHFVDILVENEIIRR